MQSRGIYNGNYVILGLKGNISCGDSSAGFTADFEEWSMKRKEWNSARLYYNWLDEDFQRLAQIILL